MSITEHNFDQDEPVLQQDELSTLKAKATLMGLPFHPSIGVDKLREKVAAALSDIPTHTEAGPPVAPVVDPVPAPTEESVAERRKRLKLEANALVRIRLTCMNPAKKEWDGEIITCGNSLVGTVKKYIPFSADEGWHVPRIMYEVLKNKQCQVFVSTKTKNGVTVRQGKLIKEFAIEVLDPLTEAELREMARRQAMAQAAD